MTHSLSFPSDFLWGASTAAYQIEGAVSEDGRKPSVWDVFSHTPGKIINDENGDTACDHYHRLEEDLDLIAALVPNYRFSISWTRILPDGTGIVNQPGVDFYNRLIDGLIARGVTPWITMFHWDLPQTLQDKGGWTNRESVDWFFHYAQTLVSLFGDRVSKWIIMNEPSVHSWLGHGTGIHAPGLADDASYLSSVHHMNMAIGKTYKALKKDNPDFSIGSSYTLLPIRPEKPDTDPHAVACMDAFWNCNFFDPLCLGRYPDVMADVMTPYVKGGDMDVIKNDLDFVGVQHYNAIEAKRDERWIFNAFFGAKAEDTPKTDVGWTIDPDAFHECLIDFKNRYGDVPVLITENGAAYFDTLGEDGHCHDLYRISFLDGYIRAVHRAMKDGVNVIGYFVWSLMDNFEWSEGYKPRFGLIHIDYENGCTRTPKDSYNWFKTVIKQNGLVESEGKRNVA